MSQTRYLQAYQKLLHCQKPLLLPGLYIPSVTARTTLLARQCSRMHVKDLSTKPLSGRKQPSQKPGKPGRILQSSLLGQLLGLEYNGNEHNFSHKELNTVQILKDTICCHNVPVQTTMIRTTLPIPSAYALDGQQNDYTDSVSWIAWNRPKENGKDRAFCDINIFIDHNMFMQYQGDGVSHKATRGWDSFLQKESHHRARHKAGGDKQDLEYNIQGSEEDTNTTIYLTMPQTHLMKKKLSSQAMWPDKDQALLIDYIIENWKEVCPGQTLQKDFWNKVVAHLAPHHIIKTTYKSLKGLINHGSNIHHDLSTGLTITAESKTQWNDFVKQYPLVAAHAFRTPEVITTGAAVSVTLAPASTTIIAHPSGQSAGSNFTARIAPRIPLSTPSGSTAGPAIPSNTPNVVGDWLGDLPSPSSILPPPSSSVRSGMSVSSKGSKGKRREHQPDTVSVSISHVTTSTGTGLDTSSAMSISSWTSKNPRILAMNKLCGVLNNHLTNIVLAILDIRDAVKKEQQVLNHTKEMLDASTAAPILLPPNVPRTNPTSIPSTRSTAAPAALATPTIAEIADTNATCLQLALWHLHKHDRHLPMQVLLHIVELFKSDTTMVELCLAMSQWDKLCCLWLESFIYGV
ncbi:hypothetical protein SERLADRAFT_411591 [Serpula lacrymans var. lacrymans S7.9]|uniref:Uncharacterized protein n=1 Tax=Serpula lacrymans var. lacrymans (strain S7.9) TaxID=578457 RepID=F8PBC8_SERL9|nr:uncharacterized protein SERLADRAFT_411591 [Serpula lacrymans var. lacrymans S7.9]EGO19568.1 hypothetical protein SERLADRAFT_411591 [Serpula lacrymans var. lacrymans S7.9]